MSWETMGKGKQNMCKVFLERNRLSYVNCKMPRISKATNFQHKFKEGGNE